MNRDCAIETRLSSPKAKHGMRAARMHRMYVATRGKLKRWYESREIIPSPLLPPRCTCHPPNALGECTCRHFRSARSTASALVRKIPDISPYATSCSCFKRKRKVNYEMIDSGMKRRVVGLTLNLILYILPWNDEIHKYFDILKLN